MTILPKKKATKDKNDSETSEHSIAHNHSHQHHQSTSETRHEKVSRSRNSPTRWLPSASRDEKLATHDPGGSFDAHDSASSHNKRRHRSSPHRNTRKYRGHSSSASSHTHGAATASSTEYDDTCSGYNSGDEYNPPAYADDIDELERWFEKALKEKKGYTIKQMAEDGNCMFRSVADQVYGDQEMNTVVRKHCVDYMAKNRDYFCHYITEDFNTYINRKRMDHCHGNHVEMQAMSEMYNRPIEVYQYSLDPINTFHGAYKTENDPIRISYHRNNHYNSIVDPCKATIGVGLGLPSFQPGLADKNLMRDATVQSEDHHIEQTMLQDKLRETDWEVTQETIEEQVARESYLQWLRDNEKRATRQGSPRTASATCSSSSECMLLENVGSPDSRHGRSPRNKSAPNSAPGSPQRVENTDQGSPRPMDIGPIATGSPKSIFGHTELPVLGPPDGPSPPGAVGGFEFNETASLMNHLPATMFDLSEWDEDDLLAQVIAQSQQEYLDTLKKNVTTSTPVHSEASCSHANNPPRDDS